MTPETGNPITRSVVSLSTAINPPGRPSATAAGFFLISYHLPCPQHATNRKTTEDRKRRACSPFPRSPTTDRSLVKTNNIA